MTGEQVVVGSIVFNLTGSSEWIGIALALYFLPIAVFGNLSGIISDRMHRSKLLFMVEILIFFNLGVFIVAVEFSKIEVWAVLLLTFFSGALRAMHSPVKASYTYDLLGGEYVVQALGVLNISIRLGMLIGALVTGYVIEFYGNTEALLCLFGSHFLALAFISFLKNPGISPTRVDSSMLKTLREYFLELRTNRYMLVIIAITGCVEIFGFSFATALPELAAGRFDNGAEGLGILHASRAMGGLAAGVILASMFSLKSRGTLYIGVIFIFGAGMVFLSIANTFLIACAAVLLIAMMATSSDILSQSILQLNVPDHLRGRAMGTWSLAIGFAPIGHLEMGHLILFLGLGGALLANGIALITLGVVVLLFIPTLRKL